jgi:hypothetical protein
MIKLTFVYFLSMVMQVYEIPYSQHLTQPDTYAHTNIKRLKGVIMKNKPMIFVLFLSVSLIGAMFGCATVKIWSSSPPVQTISNDAFEAGLEPVVKEGQNFYNRFQFRLKNKTGGPLIIDWQNCRYLQDGRKNGPFIFKGITAENINRLPPDTVATGAELSKEIAPLKLTGLEKIKSRSIQPEESPISAGIIPAGEHGILLVVKQNEKTISEKILVKITVKE